MKSREKVAHKQAGRQMLAESERRVAVRFKKGKSAVMDTSKPRNGWGAFPVEGQKVTLAAMESLSLSHGPQSPLWLEKLLQNCLCL